MSRWKLDVFAIIIVLAVCFFAMQSLRKEGFKGSWDADNRAKFMTASETQKFIFSDPDSYFHNFNEWDIIARKSSIESDYRKKAANSAMDFSSDQKARIMKAAKKADDFLSSQKCEGFPLIGIKDIPWVFALTKGTANEDGMPHTRANIIFLSTTLDETETFLFQTLVHE